MNTERNGEAKLKPVRCGCGGEAKIECANGYDPFAEKIKPNLWYGVICKKCKIQTKAFYTEAEAVTAWNLAMGERTAKVVEHDFCVTVEGLKLHEAENLCGACKKKVLGGDEYCSHCGARLIWGEE